MKRLLLLVFILTGSMSLAVQAEETGVSAEAEVQAEGGFFSRTWANVKSFFAGDDGEETAAAEAEAKAEVTAEAQAQQDDSMIDKAAEKTKAGVDWSAEKAKQGAEWTKDTAKDVTKATGQGLKKAGAALEGLVGGGDASVEAEASVEAGSD